MLDDPPPAPRRFFSSAARLLAIGACWFVALSLPAAEKNSGRSDYSITTEQVERYLSPEDVRSWRQLQIERERAEAALETGEWLANKPPSALASKEKRQADKKKGEEMVKAASEQIAGIEGRIAALHARASQQYDQLQEQMRGREITAELPLSAFDDLLERPTEEFLFRLWNRDYDRLYFLGAYAMDGPLFLSSETVSNRLRANMERFDGNRHTMEDENPAFRLSSEFGRPIIEFKDRQYIVSRFNPAVMVTVVVMFPGSPSAFYGLYAYDLDSGELIEEFESLFPASKENRDQIGVFFSDPVQAAVAVDSNTGSVLVSEETDPAAATQPTGPAEPAAESVAQGPEEPAAPAAGPEPTAPATPLIITLSDENNLLGRLKQSAESYTFQVNYIGELDGFNHRAALALNHALLKQAGFTVDSSSFLFKILDGPDGLEPENRANVTWEVTPTTPIENGTGTFAITAIAKQPDREVSVKVGTATVEAGAAEAVPRGSR